MDVAVVIPSFNSAPLIRTCLRAVMAQSVPPVEVVVVDSSSDETPLIIGAEFPSIRLIHLAERTLPGPARNIGVKQVEAELVAFTDTDCEPDREWLAQLRESFGDHVAGCTGVIAGPADETVPALADRTLCFSEFMPGAGARLVRAAPTANLMLRRQSVLDAGGFPDGSSPGEDVILCRRITTDSFMIRVCPQARVVHHSPDDAATVIDRQFRYGQAFVTIRRADQTAAGSVLLTAPFGSGLAFGAAVRYVRAVGRVAVRGEADLPRLLAAQPLLLRGAWAWARGARGPEATTRRRQAVLTRRAARPYCRGTLAATCAAEFRVRPDAPCDRRSIQLRQTLLSSQQRRRSRND